MSLDKDKKVFLCLQAAEKNFVDADESDEVDASVATGDGDDEMDADNADTDADADELDEQQLHRPGPAFTTGPQGRPYPAGEGQAGPCQEERRGEKEKPERVLGDKKLDKVKGKWDGYPDEWDGMWKGKVPKGYVPNVNARRVCWVENCRLVFVNKSMMRKHYVALHTIIISI
jgi:hypothetical protein